MPGPGPTGGVRTAWPGSATSSSSFAWGSRCGTARIRSSRSGRSGSPARRATTARTSRSTGGTWTRSPATPGTAGATTTRRARSPTQDLIATNAARTRFEPEYELLDTGAFDDDRYWIVEVHYAKAAPDDLLMTVQVDQRRTGGGQRCTCCRRPGSATPGPGTPAQAKPVLAADGDGPGPDRAPVPWHAGADRRHRAGWRRTGAAVLRERDQHRAAVRRAAPSRPTRRTASTTTWSAAPPPSTRNAPAPSARSGTRSSVAGRRDRPSSGCGCAPLPARPGRPAADAAPRRSGRRLRPGDARCAGREADEFYAELTPAAATADEAMVLRQACRRACCGASSSTTTTWTAGSTATRPSRSRRPSA